MTDSPPALPTNPPNTGTIDITNVVENLRQSFVNWGVAYVYGLEVAVPGLEWVALPVISELDKTAIQAILDLISKSVIMEAFFINTTIRKASQAQDYVSAVDAKNSLPPTATKDEYEAAEKAEMSAFRNFVLITN